MKYLPDSVQSIEFKDLLPFMRNGQLFSLSFEYHLYGGVPTHGLIAQVIRSDGKFDKILVGKWFTMKETMLEAFEKAIEPEPPADHLHFYWSETTPIKAVCGLGFSGGIERTLNLDIFLNAENRCLKCWIALVSSGACDISS